MGKPCKFFKRKIVQEIPFHNIPEIIITGKKNFVQISSQFFVRRV